MAQLLKNNYATVLITENRGFLFCLFVFSLENKAVYFKPRDKILGKNSIFIKNIYILFSHSYSIFFNKRHFVKQFKSEEILVLKISTVC